MLCAPGRGAMKIAATALLFLCAAGLACGWKDEEMPEPAAARLPAPAPPPAAVRLGPDLLGVEVVSMLRLLAAPSSMNKKSVSVVGYLEPPPSNCIHCGTLLCLHKEDADNRLWQNCLGLDLPDLTKVSPLTHRYVRVQGVVVVERPQHSTYVAIRDIRFIAPVPNREQWMAGVEVQ